jgi:hypothetical protein
MCTPTRCALLIFSSAADNSAAGEYGGAGRAVVARSGDPVLDWRCRCLFGAPEDAIEALRLELRLHEACSLL